ncbi:putative immunoglobulin-blocking virulence protein [Mycoplasma bradburyae]|uniref:putative immunoglobulin-blocking virulence protein n=1 Tax=Mycoplasma bradburyae TaxID=2963128 RepID=UPI0023420A19|nr:putative immunoglobulin-blocking virulence protein [Mycoplasma bradburyae]MDC4183995.1 putative immunoglobulin-blocking virulence protein [Mycoplasma bradburyae]
MLNSKKRKIIKLAALSATSLVVGAGSTLGIIYNSSKAESRTNLVKRSNEIKLDNDTAGTSDSYNSNRDFNLEKKPKKPDNKPVADKPLPKEPEPQPQPEPQPEPQPDPEPEVPSNLADDTPIEYVTYDHEDYGLDKEAPMQPNDPSKAVLSDEEARVVYAKSRESVNKIKNALENAVRSGNSVEARETLRKETGYDGNKDFFDAIWDKLFIRTYKRNGQDVRYIDLLLESLNSYNNDSFIMSEAKANRQIKFYVNLDGSANFAFGYRKEDDNPYIRYYRKVNEHRVLGNNDPNKWGIQNSRDILSGHFDGWKMTDATSTFVNNKEYGINNDDGIEVRHYTPENRDNDYFKNKQDLNVFVLDVDNSKGYAKFMNFLKKVKEKEPNKKIGVVLKNVGKKNTTRDVYDIIKSLPDNVETLTVFLEGADTTSLLGLEGRHLRELNLFTTGTVNTDLWGINPLAIKNINFIPSTIAYNVGGFNPYEKGATIASTPIFSTLKFDRNDDYKRVQEGLDIAKNRRSERIFQGNHQGEGAKPVFWDFADAPIIRNLKNLNVHDAELRKVRLSGQLIDSDEKGNTYVTYNLDEFNHSQWTAAMQYKPEYEKKYISFGRGTEIQQPQTLILKGDESTLQKKGLEDLLTFVKYASNSYAFKKAIVTSKFLAQQITDAVRSQRNDIQVTVAKPEQLEKFKIKKFEIDKSLNAIGKPLNKVATN